MITQTYDLNLIPNSAITLIRCSQYDSESRTLTFNLYNGAVAYNVPSLCTVTIRGTKKDGTGFEYPCEFTDNVVTFDLKDQMTLFAGDLMCELRISYGSQVLGSANFILAVEKSPLDAETAISESEYPIYEELVRRAEEAAALSEGVKTVNGEGPDAEGNVELQTLPSGGTAGQTIIKQSATEGDAIWADLNATGIELTQAQYDALPQSEKMNGSLYFIIDGESAPSANRFSADGISYGSGSVADALDKLQGSNYVKFAVVQGSGNVTTAGGFVTIATTTPSGAVNILGAPIISVAASQSINSVTTIAPMDHAQVRVVSSSAQTITIKRLYIYL